MNKSSLSQKHHNFHSPHVPGLIKIQTLLIKNFIKQKINRSLNNQNNQEMSQTIFPFYPSVVTAKEKGTDSNKASIKAIKTKKSLSPFLQLKKCLRLMRQFICFQKNYQLIAFLEHLWSMILENHRCQFLTTALQLHTSQYILL